MGTKRVILYIETSSGYGRNLLRGIVEYARCFGPWEFYRIPPFYHRDRQARTHVLRRLARWGPEGAIVREPRPDDDVLALKIPTIVSPSAIVPTDLPAVVTDDAGAGRLAAEHLLGRGFRHLAFCGYEDLSWSTGRERAFCGQVRLAGKSVMCFVPTRKPGSGRSPMNEMQQLSAWLASLPKPCGVFACNDDRGSDVAGACELAGIRVPEQVAIVSADNDDLACSMTRPELSSVNFETTLAGYQAAALLDRLMSKQERMAGQRIVDRAISVTARGSTNTSAIDDELVASAVGQIRRNIRRRIRAEDLVQAADVSRTEFYRRFRRAMGVSIYRFIVTERVAEIKRLLEETTLTVRQIAYALGEDDDKNIGRLFARETGLSPSMYRKNLTKD